MDVTSWVTEYERAWRAQDVPALDGLFTPDAVYLRSAYDDGLVGLPAIRDFWSDDQPFTMTWEPVAAEGDTAVVRVEVHYGGAEPHEYRDLWIITFADDGRARRFEEWAHWPGMPGWSSTDPGASD
ncbi:nuclear transport factor 2 family protein [Cellulomonas edaphi]|uniref:Nuclear transport factor 2 family protein n=1 Tax=Cellulomonas edaphi TaxID=3053468 RepID=A0ABT7SA87_9CELL|nr:nuclear transport factor 2 family protein [Cellulomons edaphi]MDM7832526.1 nuclear transport factor 2 family protein [Cellulomons edaphi]